MSRSLQSHSNISSKRSSHTNTKPTSKSKSNLSAHTLSKSKSRNSLHNNSSQKSKSINPTTNKDSNSRHSNNGSLLKYIMGEGHSPSSKSNTSVDYTNSKNKMYKYRKTSGEEYAIHFAAWDELNTKCYVFSDVEWVITYYKPKLHSNIILETFTNTIKKLIHHLDGLQRSEGELIMKSPELENGELVIGNPGTNSLYHMPNTNLHYLKINSGDIGSIYNTIQMTFSANIADVFFIMKNMMEDKLCSYAGLTQVCQLRLDYFNKLEMCAKLLIKNFNKKELTFKIISTENKLILRQIKNYIILILYKLYIYYNNYLTSEDKSKLLKVLLPMNVRHGNYLLYIELKKCLSQLFEGKTDPQGNSANIPEIVKRIFIQSDILYQYLVVKKEYVRRNAFNITNQLDKSNNNYGNPWYSMSSYFDFFEHPIYSNELYIIHDWLEYANIDVLSTRMDINDNIVLVEFRAFPYLLKSYIYSILDPIEREEMDTSTRNILGLISVKTLKTFINNYDKKYYVENEENKGNTVNAFGTRKRQTKKSNKRKTNKFKKN